MEEREVTFLAGEREVTFLEGATMEGRSGGSGKRRKVCEVIYPKA
jgi:hypothetical protein